MKKIPSSCGLLASIPVDKIVAVATTDPGYEMSRMIYVEDWPEYDDHTVVDGGHCSCYGFDDTEWDGVTYTRAELSKIAKAWLGQGFGAERIIAPHILRNLA